MQIGYSISGVAHVGLIGWVLFGGAFQPSSEPFEVTEVTAISEAEFDSLFNTTAPDAAATDVVVPEPPQEQPEEAAPLRPPPRPEPPQPVEPEPEQPAPPPADDITVIAPEPEAPETDGPVTPEPLRPQAADRVAPTPVEQPDPEDQVADVAQEVETSDQAGEEQLPEQERTVEEAAATEIVTEAKEGDDVGLSRSLRPRLRPNRPEPPREVAQPAPDNTQSAVDDLLAGLADEETTEPPRPARPSGPPLSAGEKDALRVAVQKCWNTGSLSSAALNTTVVVAVEMSEDGKPNVGTIRMVSSSGGTGGSVNQAFQAARRAIIRCGARGFALPAEKYEQWREIEMTFNPEKMRIK
ncbi:hypothetical protein [Thalassovita mediterranea]|jgi:hypothetical protein|uniref:Protein TolA n=1 Tax=Thalassovita mediterranea TaxID=340021 RepID=A0A0P1H341_9RHOB|nr:hypothetical protein [Thalassovita mediterranea]CUH84017.1 protein TolA [Thalassovita mediterranea]SIS27884.1 Cell division and transport-associated protein TolA [Thalassovita mediterranea]